VDWSSRSRALTVNVPFTTADQLYYRRDSDKLRISNDLRVLFDKKCEVDPRGFYSLLQFGTTVPPLTLWRGISEFIPGRHATVNADGSICVEQEPAIQWPNTEPSDRSLALQDQIDILTGLIDQILIEACPTKDPVILFSGGVDSGVLAARAAAMGWKDATLVNYCFGNDDTESMLAESMAKELGMGFVRISDGDYSNLEVLKDIGRIYARPFGDPSLSPTYALARAIVDQFPRSRVILDGTGADGAFALFSKTSLYRNVYRIPHLVRKSVEYLYGVSGSWMIDSRIERIGRVLSRSSQLPIVFAAIARNPLANIAYRVRPDVKREVLELASSWVSSIVPSASLEARLPAADLAINCSRVLAQKTKSVFDAYDRQVVYPFLDSRMIGLSLQRARHWPGCEEPKRVLKAILASHVPSEMVYRPKSGFVGPYKTIFSKPEFVTALDRVLEHETALTEFVNLSALRRLRDRVRSQTPLPGQTYWFIWATVFTQQWLEALETRAGSEIT
jgi:asparagine synthetase B (glutamine-hydrolysing)